MDDYKNMLIIRSGAIGDVIMATPLVKNIRENFPDSQITFLVGNWSKNVLLNNPNVNKILPFDDKIIIKKNIVEVVGLLRKIRKMKFDLCFILDKSWMWGLFAYLCNIKIRIGFSRGYEGLFNTDSVKFTGEKNEVDYDLDLLGKVGIKAKEYLPELYTTVKDRKKADKVINMIRNNKRIIGICPGGAINGHY